MEQVFKKIENMSEENRNKFSPVMNKIIPLLETFNKGIELKNNFFAQFTTLAGVLFGVFATLNTMGKDQWADIAYLFGIVCCGVCLLLCVVCLYKPIYDNNRQVEKNMDSVMEEMLDIIKKEQCHVLESDENNKQDSNNKSKKYFPFNKLRVVAYILFCVAIICMMIKIVLLFYRCYY